MALLEVLIINGRLRLSVNAQKYDGDTTYIVSLEDNWMNTCSIRKDRETATTLCMLFLAIGYDEEALGMIKEHFGASINMLRLEEVTL